MYILREIQLGGYIPASQRSSCQDSEAQ